MSMFGYGGDLRRPDCRGGLFLDNSSREMDLRSDSGLSRTSNKRIGLHKAILCFEFEIS